MVFYFFVGAMKGVVDMDLKINVVGCMACAENAIGEKAYKPSDVITSLNGMVGLFWNLCGRTYC